MLVEENIGEFSCLDYFEKTLAIGHQFAKFTNVFSCQCFRYTVHCLSSQRICHMEFANYHMIIIRAVKP